MTPAPTTPESGNLPDAAQIQRVIAADLAVPSRLGYVVLLVTSATAAVLLGSLWITEPSLPARTHVAFGAMMGILLSWMALAVWVLTTRRVLLGRDRLVAARMALTFTATSAVATFAAAVWADLGQPAFIGALAQLPLCVLAAAVLVRARRRVEQLSTRKRELESQLSK